MESFHSEDELEIDCYEKILKYFNQRKDMKRDDFRLWKNLSLVKIMEVWNRTRNITLVRNSLILMISLFENLPPDIYNNRGIDINRCSRKDRESLVSSLKDEFLAN